MAIKISKNRIDMDLKPIRNAGRIDATELHGIVYYTDIHFEEKECAVCAKRFKPGNGVGLIVTKVTRKGSDYVPAHIMCLIAEEEKRAAKKGKKK